MRSPHRSLILAVAATVLGCNAAPAAMAGLPASSDPAALARGPISRSADPADLAIDGDAFFVLARAVPPRSLDDLVFSRAGDFWFEYQPKDALPREGAYRLVNADGLAVMCWRAPVDQNVRPFGTPPEESSGSDLAAFRTVVTNGREAPLALALGPVEIPHAHNPEAANNLSFDNKGFLRLDGDAPRDAAGRPENLCLILANVETPSALRHQGGGYLSWAPAAGRIFTGTASDSRPNRTIGRAVVLRGGALERLPLLTPSRFDRERYPDALDPRAVLPSGEATIKGALVTAVQPSGSGDSAGLTVQLVALSDGVATEQRWAVTAARNLAPIQRRGDVLRPVVWGGLARGAIVDVWADAASQALAIVLDRDDRPDAGADVFGTGWL